MDSLEEVGAVLRHHIRQNILFIDAAHYVLMAQSVRDEYGLPFSRSSPLACWFSTILCSFSGTFLTNFLLGDALIAPFMNHFDIIVCTSIWYLYFFSPFDIFARFCSYSPLRSILALTKEFQRAYKIGLGVDSGMTEFPAHRHLQVLVGCSKGNGSGIIKSLQQWVYGSWRPHENELLKPSTTSKATLIAAILFASQLNKDIALLCSLCLLVGCKAAALAGITKTPFNLIETPLQAIFFGLPRKIETSVEDTPKEVKRSPVVSDSDENNNRNGKTRRRKQY